MYFTRLVKGFDNQRLSWIVELWCASIEDGSSECIAPIASFPVSDKDSAIGAEWMISRTLDLIQPV